MPDVLEAKCLLRCEHELAEGPLYENGHLFWVDIKGCLLLCLSLEDGRYQQRHIPEQVTSINRAVDRGYVVTTRRGFGFLSSFDAALDYLNDVEPEHPGNRFNDAKVDPFGQLWAGTMDDGEQQASGRLYRMASDMAVTVEDDDYIITNGPTFSPDGSRLYHADTVRRTIYQYDLSSKGISDKREFVKLGDADGHPDGMTTDAEGGIWVCHYGGWRVSRFSPEGKLLMRVTLPVSNVTSATFGGDLLDTLFITTARQGLTASDLAKQPLAGSIFHVKVPVKGLAANSFGEQGLTTSG
jgi:D-xylonolactonase